MKGWDCILKNISETVGCNLSSEGKMSLGSGKQICLLGMVMPTQKTLSWRKHGVVGLGAFKRQRARVYNREVGRVGRVQITWGLLSHTKYKFFNVKWCIMKDFLLNRNKIIQLIFKLWKLEDMGNKGSGRIGWVTDTGGRWWWHGHGGGVG